ncbi:hypothetical protein BHE74_00010125 [Ensete ventricosum]|nr:hypothetical protein BHE74_00010125 [Ensete ventricosum]
MFQKGRKKGEEEGMVEEGERKWEEEEATKEEEGMKKRKGSTDIPETWWCAARSWQAEVTGSHLREKHRSQHQSRSQQLREKLKVARKWDLGFPTSLYTMDRSRVCLHIVNARSVGEIRDGDEGELNHHVISAIGGGTGEDKVRGDGDENAQEEEEGLGDHRVPSVNLVDAHPPKAGLETPKLIVNVGEVACVQRPAMQ